MITVICVQVVYVLTDCLWLTGSVCVQVLYVHTARYVYISLCVFLSVLWSVCVQVDLYHDQAL